MEELKALSIYDLMLGNMVYGIYVDEDTQQTSFYLCKIVGLDSSGLAEYPVMVESEDKFDKYQYDWFEGIPIDEKHLIRLGFFVSKVNKNPCYSKGCLSFVNGSWIYGDYDNDIFVYLEVNINFVHELQNLYFSLTRKQLTYESN
jgi:hypothetical protein